MLWSILIAAIPERYHTVQPLLYKLLEKQSVARMPDVQWIYLMDNRRMSVGEKRNHLLRMARGEYVTFIDDDDDVSDDYVVRIHDGIVASRKQDEPVDVICFPQRALLQPANIVHECTYSLKHWREREPEKRRVLEDPGKPGTLNWSGPPAHTMCWRREVVKDFRFDEKNFGEDVAWVDGVCAKAKTEMQLGGEAIYIYRFDERKTATR